MPVDHVFMHPAIDVAPMRFGGQTPSAQRTRLTDGPEAGIANLQFAGAVSLITLHRPQQAARRTAVDISRGVVDKRLHDKAPLLREPLVTVRSRHVANDG